MTHSPFFLFSLSLFWEFFWWRFLGNHCRWYRCVIALPLCPSLCFAEYCVHGEVFFFSRLSNVFSCQQGLGLGCCCSSCYSARREGENRRPFLPFSFWSLCCCFYADFFFVSSSVFMYSCFQARSRQSINDDTCHNFLSLIFFLFSIFTVVVALLALPPFFFWSFQEGTSQLWEPTLSRITIN